MDVILLENIRNLGKIGEVVKVRDGYGRNFLIKTGKALRADKENKIIFQKKKDEINKKNLESKKIAKTIFDKIKNKKLNFQKETKDNGDLFASIKPKEISNLIKNKVNADVSPSQIILKEELNKVGTFKVDINFHSEVKACISIKIDKIQSK